MINIDSLTIKAFLNENRDKFKGAILRKIKQPSRRDLILILRNNHQNYNLYINIDPNFYHISFISEASQNKRYLEIPKQAHMFCMLLRKYVLNSKIIDVNQPNSERIIEFIISSYIDEEKKQLKTFILCVEFMGKHSNIILYDQETKIIIGSIHNVGLEKSCYREIKGTKPYIYPIKKNKCDINQISYDEFKNKIETSNLPLKNLLTQTFFDISNNFATKFIKCNSIENIKEFYTNLKKYINLDESIICPTIDSDFSTFSIFDFCENKEEAVNSVIDKFFSYHMFEYKFNTLKNKIQNTLLKEIKKINGILLNLELQNDKEKGLKYKHYGDILMSNLYNSAYNSHIDKITLYDYNTEKNIEIELDPLLNLKDNANKYYQKYNKLKSSHQYSKNRISQLTQIKQVLESELFYLSISNTIEELNQIKQSCDKYFNIKQSDDKIKNEINVIIKKIDIDGYVAYIGKNSKQNDYILSKLSKSNDIWIHAKNGSSAHGLIKNTTKEEIPDIIIFKVAKIVKEITYNKSASKISMIYTKRKYVSKANSKGLGFVTYKNEKEILID